MLSSLNFYSIGTGEQSRHFGKRGHELFHKVNFGGKLDGLRVRKKGKLGDQSGGLCHGPAAATRSAVRTDNQWRGTQHVRTDNEPELCWALRKVLEYDLNDCLLEPRDDEIRPQKVLHLLRTKRL